MRAALAVASDLPRTPGSACTATSCQYLPSAHLLGRAKGVPQREAEDVLDPVAGQSAVALTEFREGVDHGLFGADDALSDGPGVLGGGGFLLDGVPESDEVAAVVLIAPARGWGRGIPMGVGRSVSEFQTV